MSDEMIDEDVGAEDDEPSDPPRWTLIDDLNGRLEGSWVRRIARMRPPTIKKLAKAASLTEEQVEGILWSAKSRVNPLHGVHARPPRGLTALR